MMRKAHTIGAGRALALGVLASLLLAACGDNRNRYAPPPPPPVTVTHPVVKAVTRYLDLTGSASAVATVDLVARVAGYLESVDFQDGTVVKKGDLLFVIERAPYEANLQLAEATLAQERKLPGEPGEVALGAQLRGGRRG
jgi:multidrug efflux system membrane fusion protein